MDQGGRVEVDPSLQAADLAAGRVQLLGCLQRCPRLPRVSQLVIGLGRGWLAWFGTRRSRDPIPLGIPSCVDPIPLGIPSCVDPILCGSHPVWIPFPLGSQRLWARDGYPISAPNLTITRLRRAEVRLRALLSGWVRSEYFLTARQSCGRHKTRAVIPSDCTWTSSVRPEVRP